MCQKNAIPISICILTKNNETKIERCLAALMRFDEILVLDTGSMDRTLEIVEEFAQTHPNTQIFHQDGIENFGETRNAITKKAKNDWIFHVDADEFLTTELVDYLASANLDPSVVYAVRHRLFYCDRPLPPFDSWLRRIYNRKTTSWSLRKVHESLILDNVKVIHIPKNLDHHSLDSVEQLVAKQQFYSTLYADQFHAIKKAGAWAALAHGIFRFVNHYFIKGCIWYGYDGFVMSSCHAFGTFLKYVKVYERNRKPPKYS